MRFNAVGLAAGWKLCAKMHDAALDSRSFCLLDGFRSRFRGGDDGHVIPLPFARRRERNAVQPVFNFSVAGKCPAQYLALHFRRVEHQVGSHVDGFTIHEQALCSPSPPDDRIGQLLHQLLVGSTAEPNAFRRSLAAIG